MPIKRVKNESCLVAKWKLKSSERPHYFHVFLWDSQENFLANTHGHTLETVACHEPMPYKIDLEGGEPLPSRKLGEVHFVKGSWTLEVVAHELCHALIHRLRVLCPGPRMMVNQEGDAEETICYEFGRWVDCMYRLLWEVDPPSSWVRSGG